MLVHNEGDLKFYFDEASDCSVEAGAKKQKLFECAIQKIGFDPRKFCSDGWSLSIGDQANEFSVPIHPHTLRPYSTVNGRPWQYAARDMLGYNVRFVSENAHICNFVIKYAKLPTYNEFVLFVYQAEMSKEREIMFKKEFNSDSANS